MWETSTTVKFVSLFTYNNNNRQGHNNDCLHMYLLIIIIIVTTGHTTVWRRNRKKEKKKSENNRQGENIFICSFCVTRSICVLFFSWILKSHWRIRIFFFQIVTYSQLIFDFWDEFMFTELFIDVFYVTQSICLFSVSLILRSQWRITIFLYVTSLILQRIFFLLHWFFLYDYMLLLCNDDNKHCVCH